MTQAASPEASSPTIEEIVTHYIGLRDRRKQIEHDADEACKPIKAQMEKIEVYLLAKMNADGVDSYKTKAGTPYKVNKTSCTMADSNIFKEFVFSPVVNYLRDHFGLPPEVTGPILMQGALWPVVDFRALKKGVEEYLEDKGQVPPGLNVTTVTTVNIRGA